MDVVNTQELGLRPLAGQEKTQSVSQPETVENGLAKEIVTVGGGVWSELSKKEQELTGRKGTYIVTEKSPDVLLKWPQITYTIYTVGTDGEVSINGLIVKTDRMGNPIAREPEPYKVLKNRVQYSLFTSGADVITDKDGSKKLTYTSYLFEQDLILPEQKVQ